MIKTIWKLLQERKPGVVVLNEFCIRLEKSMWEQASTLSREKAPGHVPTPPSPSAPSARAAYIPTYKIPPPPSARDFMPNPPPTSAKKHKTCHNNQEQQRVHPPPTRLFDVPFLSSSLRDQLTKTFSQDLSYRSIDRYNAPLQEILLSLHPSINSSYYCTVSSLQAAMRKPDVAYALIKTHGGLHKQALSAYNRFLRILDLTIERNCRGEKHLLVVEESTEDKEEEITGSEDEEVEDEGAMGRRVAL